jgi:uncharacterized protein
MPHFTTLPADFSLPLALCALLAGIVRGFSGFGLSAVLVASGSFFIAPKSLIPAAQFLEIIASIALLKSVWKDVNWRWLKAMAAGYAISIPIGVAALSYAPQTWLRVAGCVVILIASLCLLMNLRLPLRDGLGLRFGTGLLAGFLAGASSIGGMVASVMLFAAELPAKSLRATLVVLFFLSALYSLSWGVWHGVANTQTFTLGGTLAIPLLIGIAIGTRGFSIVTPEKFKRYVLMILAVLAVAGIVSVALSSR